jgi:hypothetical protein
MPGMGGMIDVVGGEEDKGTAGVVK